MKNILLPISFTSVLVFTYAISAGLELNESLVMTLFLVVNVAFIWMVIRILKDGKPSERSFDEYFYEDVDKKRS